jgi:hypothetical protein
MLLFKSMTGSDLLTKLVLLAYLHFERSYSDTSQLCELLNLGLSKNKLEKALGYLVDEGYLVKKVTIQQDGRLKKCMCLPSAVTDECKFIWQGYADSSRWERALEQILKSASSCQKEQSAETHSLTELDHFVMITCLLNADEFRYFTDSNAKCIAESIGINVTQFKRSFSKLIKSNLINHVTNGFNASTLFGKITALFRIELRPLGFDTVNLVPEFEHLRLRKSPKFLRLLKLHKIALDKPKRSMSKSKRARILPRPPSSLLNMGISDSDIHRLTAQFSDELFQALHEIFIYAILVSIRNNVNQSRRLQDDQCEAEHLFQSINASVSAVISEILSYEEPKNCEVTECPEPTSLSTDEPKNSEVTECSEPTSLSTDEPKNSEVTECSEPTSLSTDEPKNSEVTECSEPTSLSTDEPMNSEETECFEPTSLYIEELKESEVTKYSELTSLSAEEREYFRTFVVSWLIAEAVDVGLLLAKQCKVFAKTNPGLDFNNCCFIYTFGSVGFRVKTEDGKALKKYYKPIDFVISDIIHRAQDGSPPVIDRIFDNGVLYEVVELKPRVSKAKGVKKVDVVAPAKTDSTN